MQKESQYPIEGGNPYFQGIELGGKTLEGLSPEAQGVLKTTSTNFLKGSDLTPELRAVLACTPNDTLVRFAQATYVLPDGSERTTFEEEHLLEDLSEQFRTITVGDHGCLVTQGLSVLPHVVENPLPVKASKSMLLPLKDYHPRI